MKSFERSSGESTLDPAERARILATLNVCGLPSCKAHDRLVEAALELEKAAFRAGMKEGLFAAAEKKEG